METYNKYIDLVNTDNDFGFTLAEETEIVVETVQYSSLKEEVEDLRMRIAALNKMFLPFLENLSKDPSKTMIKWPNRAEVVNKQIVKLKQLTNI